MLDKNMMALSVTEALPSQPAHSPRRALLLTPPSQRLEVIGQASELRYRRPVCQSASIRLTEMAFPQGNNILYIQKTRLVPVYKPMC